LVTLGGWRLLKLVKKPFQNDRRLYEKRIRGDGREWSCETVSLLIGGGREGGESVALEKKTKS